jgi:hypothetical protein
LSACAICDESIGGRTRLEGFSAFEGPHGELFARETIAVVHAECWMRLTPVEREALTTSELVERNDVDDAEH